MKVLLTGFNPFADIQVNPSQLVVDAIALKEKKKSDIQITTEILPTEFIKAGNRIQELIQKITPALFLGLGVSEERRVLRIERVALNLDDSVFPDNAGFTPVGKLIVDDGPLAYFSNFPLLHLKKKLQTKGIPIEISNHAGTYVCNHVFYLAMHQIKKLDIDTICGFIHLPLISDHGSIFKMQKINIQGFVLFIEFCLEFLVKFKR
jgi:pyroglutamyl-peptidase